MNSINPRTSQRMLVASIVLFTLATLFLGLNVAAVLSAPLASVIDVPSSVGFEGYLVDGSGVPVSDTVDLTFKIYDAATGGNLRWSETITNVPVVDGLYAVSLGLGTPFTDTSVIFSDPRWIGITYGGNELTPRTKISAVPFAINASHANAADVATQASNANTVANLSPATSGTNAHLLQTDSNGNATVSGGLNVGSATGAATGEVRASGDVRISSSSRLIMNGTSYFQVFEDPALASNGTINLGGFRGLIMISNASDDRVELVIARGGTASAVSLGGSPAAFVNLNSDNGSTFALYMSGGNWILKNRYGTAKSARVQLIVN